jgi:serine/threonine protein kinase
MTEAHNPGSRNTAEFRPGSLAASAGDIPEDPRIVEVVTEYLTHLEKGENPDRAAYIQRYPDLASAIEQCLEGLEMVHTGLKGQRGAESDRRSDAGPLGQSEMVPESLGDFRIVREIARGGMGVVYEATQLSLARRVALKVLPFAATLDARHLQRFKTEAQAAALLHHTNIVPVYAVGCERGVHFYAMQLIEGQSLAVLIAQLRRQAGLPASDEAPSRDSIHSSYVLGNDVPPDLSAASRRERPVAPAIPVPDTASKFHAALSTQHAGRDSKFFKTAARLMLQAAQALEHAHEFGIIHRDIKPANLLLDTQGVLWVADFGLAQFHADVGLTRTGDILGTLRYMSPEQASGQKALLDRRTDVYSLGATFYELLTLVPIFKGRDVQFLLHQVLHAEPRPLRQLDKAIPAELETIILKSVSKNPDDRYRSAGDLAADLQRYLDHQPILARRPSLVERARKWSRRHPSVVISGMLLMTVVAVALSISNRREQLRANEAEQHTQEAQKHSRETEKHLQQARQVVDVLIEFSEEELAGNGAMDGTRQRLLGIALGYYQDFVDQQGHDAAGQAGLEKIQERVNRILHEMDVLQHEMHRGALENPKVQEDLALADDQQERLTNLQVAWKLERERDQKDFWSLSEELRRKRMILNAEEHDRELKELLSGKQRQRLTEIVIQSAGILAFRNPDIVKELKLTSEQRKAIREIEREVFRPPFDPAFDSWRPGHGPPDKNGPSGKDWPPSKRGEPPRLKKSESVAKVLAILTSDQIATWQALIGDSFAGIDDPPFRGGPPGFGPHPHDRHGPRGGMRGERADKDM